MDILLILVLFFIAWLLGHALDKLFTQVENFVKGKQPHDEIFTTKTANSVHPNLSRSSRLYLIPSATDKSTSQS
ncbi:hypothetical protein BH11CYA1_BH11CYA1_03630 [soil metagenome]